MESKPAYLTDMRSLAYSVLLVYYVYRVGLSDEELSARLSEEGIVTDGSEGQWRKQLTRDCFLYLEAVEQVTNRWRLTEPGRKLIEEDLVGLLALKTSAPVKEKAEGAITNLKSFLRSTRALDPF